MTTPTNERLNPLNKSRNHTSHSSEGENTFVDDDYSDDNKNYIARHNTRTSYMSSDASPQRTREQEQRVEDELTLLQAERVVSKQNTQTGRNMDKKLSMSRSRTRISGSEHVDEFDEATNPVHEKASAYTPPHHPTTSLGKLVKRIHGSSVVVRNIFYVLPVCLVLLIPLLLGAFVFKSASVGGVQLMWFMIWLEIFWLALWIGRLIAKILPWPMGLISSIFTNNSKKWRDMGKQLELPATLFFWFLAVEISFVPTMSYHRVGGDGNQPWIAVANKIIISVFTGVTLNFAEKLIIQLIAISFHLRTYADRIELNKFQIGSLTKLYKYSKEKIALDDSEFEEGDTSGAPSGARTPMQYVDKAQRNITEAVHKVGDAMGKVAGDFTGRQVVKSTHPHQVVLQLLHTIQGGQVLARRLFRTFLLEGRETILADDLKHAFDNNEEADAAFSMFDKDLNGDISMEELEAVCVEIGRERKSITASLKDLDSVISKLDGVLFFVVFCVTVLVFISLISTSAAGVLTSAGSTVLALSWLLSATAQEFMQSTLFVFVKHPFDVGDRVTIYGNTGSMMRGDDYFVKEISLLYTEFKKMEGHVVQAPNSYLNTLFILNMRRSGGLAEAVSITVKFGTTLSQIEDLRNHLLEFVKSEKREYQGNILTEIRDIVEAHSVNINVVFFYKSNWQNEGLRLSRRNKFICAMMIAMQEVGIEGPRMRIPGQKEEIPFYVQHLKNDGHSPIVNGGEGTDNRTPAFVPAISETNSTGVGLTRQTSGSILRSRTSASRSATRPRGESIASMSKRVDFSLGMKDMSSGDMMGDIFDENSKPRVPFTPQAIRDRIEEEVREEEEQDEREEYYEKNKPKYPSRRSLSLRGSKSVIHRNRFFGRGRSRDDRNSDDADEDLMEQGLAEVPESSKAINLIVRSGNRLGSRLGGSRWRAGTVTSTNDSSNSAQTAPTWLEGPDMGDVPLGSNMEDFELKKMHTDASRI